MKVIRQNVFETNSSSMHSLVISKNAKLTDNYFELTIRKGKIVYDDENYLYFGRTPFRILNTLELKLRYFISRCFYMYTKEYEDVLNDLLLPIINNINHYKFYNIHIDRICLPIDNNQYTTSKSNKIDIKSSDFYKQLQDNNISLERYLTDPCIIVIVDGDEYYIYKTLRDDLGLIKDTELDIDLDD